MALLAVLAGPLSLTAIDAIFGRYASFHFGQLADTITMAFLAPLLVGMVARLVQPSLIERFAEPTVHLAGTILLVLVVLIMATNFSAMIGVVLNGSPPLLAATSLRTGHFLNRPDSNPRTAWRSPAQLVFSASACSLHR